MISVIRSLLLWTLVGPLLVSAFYLPGVAPTTYHKGDNIPLLVNHLTPSMFFKHHDDDGKDTGDKEGFLYSYDSVSYTHLDVYKRQILVGGNFNGVAKINLTTGFLVSSAQEFGTGGSTTGMYHYSNGLLLTGSYQTNSNDQLEILTYDGSAFSSFGNLNNNVINIVNYTLDDSELLLFNNAYIFNVSSNAYITNSSTLSIAGYSAGANSNNDSLLFGSILTRTLGNLNGMVVLDPNGTITTSNIPEIPVCLLYTSRCV